VPAVSTIDDDALQRAWHESEYRIDVCRDRRGTYCASVSLRKHRENSFTNWFRLRVNTTTSY